MIEFLCLALLISGKQLLCMDLELAHAASQQRPKESVQMHTDPQTSADFQKDRKEEVEFLKGAHFLGHGFVCPEIFEKLLTTDDKQQRLQIILECVKKAKLAQKAADDERNARGKRPEGEAQGFYGDYPPYASPLPGNKQFDCPHGPPW